MCNRCKRYFMEKRSNSELSTSVGQSIQSHSIMSRFRTRCRLQPDAGPQHGRAANSQTSDASSHGRTGPDQDGGQYEEESTEDGRSEDDHSGLLATDI